LPDSAQNDSDPALSREGLAVVVSAWSGLPEAIRARIVGLVEGATANVGEH
jgi:hypothetical protein